MFSQIKYFIAVVEQHSFTLAAEECHISQSAISQQIKELEATLGVALLDRHGRTFTVTAAGQYFYRHGKDLLVSVDFLIKGTQQFNEPDQYQLNVGYLRDFGTGEFLQAVADFSSQYPQIKINITSGNHESLYRLMQSQKLDLIFSDQRRALSDRAINHFLTASPLMVAASVNQLKDRQNVDVDDLKDLTCLIIQSDPEDTSTIEYYQGALGIRSDFQIVGTKEAAEMLMATNQGYAIVNERTQDQFNSAVIQARPLVHHQEKFLQKYFAYWDKDNGGYFVEAFAKLLANQFK